MTENKSDLSISILLRLLENSIKDMMIPLKMFSVVHSLLQDKVVLTLVCLSNE